MLKPENLKLIAGVSIVITAFGIMLQGVLGYVFSLARLGLIIVIAVVVSSALAFGYQFLIKKSNRATASSNSEENT